MIHCRSFPVLRQGPTSGIHLNFQGGTSVMQNNKEQTTNVAAAEIDKSDNND